jgi:hypothetical protein
MFPAIKGQVAMDLIGDDCHPMSFADIGKACKRLTIPQDTAGIMGIAEE